MTPAPQRRHGFRIQDTNEPSRPNRRSRRAGRYCQLLDNSTVIRPRQTPLPSLVTAVPQLREELRAGRTEALDQILPLVYDELRRTARRELAARPSDTLSATGLVHEVYLKFSRSEGSSWQNRAHFLSVAAIAMRHILVDRARRRTAEKRGGSQRPITLDDGLVDGGHDPEALLELDEALNDLARIDERLARVVECRFFGGMTEEETAESLGITARTVRRDWTKAKAILYRALKDPPSHTGQHRGFATAGR